MRALFAAAATAALLASAAFAQEYKIGPLEIDHPWSRATPKGAKIAGGYLTIRNTGSTPDRLLGGTMREALRVEVHEMTMAGGVMKMRPLIEGIEIKPGETVELKPGGYHLMFLELKAPLAKGEHVHGTLAFEKAGTLELDYTVEDVGQKSSTPGTPMR